MTRDEILRYATVGGYAWTKDEVDFRTGKYKIVKIDTEIDDLLTLMLRHQNGNPQYAMNNCIVKLSGDDLVPTTTFTLEEIHGCIE